MNYNFFYRFADIFTKRMKTFLIILFTLGAIALICFAVVCQGFFKIPFHTITGIVTLKFDYNFHIID